LVRRAEANPANKRQQQAWISPKGLLQISHFLVMLVTGGASERRNPPHAFRYLARLTPALTASYNVFAAKRLVLALTLFCDADHTNAPPFHA
jgi:hypothetical protein